MTIISNRSKSKYTNISIIVTMVVVILLLLSLLVALPNRGSKPMDTEYYQLREMPDDDEFKKLGLTKGDPTVSWQSPFRLGIIGVVAIEAGELRPPIPGEWYLDNEPNEKARRARVSHTVRRKCLKLVTVKTTITQTHFEMG